MYRRFLAVGENLAAAAVERLAEPASGGPTVLGGPAAGWAKEVAPAIVDRVGASLLAGDSQILLDYLMVELAELRRTGIPESHLTTLMDALGASLPDDPGLPDGFRPARLLLIEGRDHLRRAGARPVRSVPPLRALPGAAKLEPVRPPGEAFADLLLLGALACQAPAALLSVPQPDGTWSTLSYGLDAREGINDGQLFEAIAASREPVEFSDLASRLPRSPFVLPPHMMRWGYGVAVRKETGSVAGVVVILDHWLRQLTKREQRALGSLARQLSSQLANWRQPDVASVHSPPPVPSVSNGKSRSDRSASFPGALGSPRHQLLRSHEVAEIFDVTERTVINWAAAGKLPSLRTIGGHLRFRREDVTLLVKPG
jgi:excisionase family DNA binding protein